MKKIIGIIIMLGFGLSAFAQSFDHFNFQGYLYPKDTTTALPSEVKIKLSIQHRYSAMVFYAEEHLAKVGSNGTFNLQIGTGENAEGNMDSIKPELPIVIKTFIDFDNNGTWVDAGESLLNSVPYAFSANRTSKSSSGGTNDTEDERILRVQDAFYVVGTDTSFALLTKGNGQVGTKDGQIGTGGYTQPWQAFSVGKDQRVYMYSTQDDPYLSALVNFHWTIESSKPAIVMYDENFVRHYAVVAHYWSHSGRAHQHISMEVDDDDGAVQTRFEFPWGDEWIDIETHSTDFRIDDGGSLLVGYPEDTSKAIFYGNSFFYQNLNVAHDSTFTDQSESVWNIAAEDKSTYMDIIQKDGTSDARLRVRSDAVIMGLAVKNTALNFVLGTDAVANILNSGLVGIGRTPSRHTLEVEGNVKADQFISTNNGFGEFLPADMIIEQGDLKNGDLVGIKPETGKYRKYMAGDTFIGVYTSLLSQIGLRANNSNSGGKLIVSLGIVTNIINSAQITVVDQKVYTKSDNKYIGLKLADGTIILKP